MAEEVRKVCKKCRNYKRPKCELKGKFTSREESCSSWEVR